MRQETVSAAQNAASEVSIFKAAETASPTSEVNSTSENCSAMYPAAASATRYFHNNIKGIQFSLLATVPTTESHPPNYLVYILCKTFSVSEAFFEPSSLLEFNKL